MSKVKQMWWLHRKRPKSRRARYREESLIESDKNLVENAIRPLASERKNYLFLNFAVL